MSEAFPHLTQEQWDAALRMITLLCLAFEGVSADGREIDQQRLDTEW